MAAGLPAWFVVLVVAALGFTIGFSKGGFAAVGAVLTPLLSLVLSQGKGERGHTVVATALEEIIGTRFSDWK